MLCYTEASNEKIGTNGCTDGLGNRRDAGASLTEHLRKSESAAPFPLYDRLEFAGKLAILINLDGSGWKALTEHGELINPWTGAPFRKLEDCRKAVKFFLKKSKWPKIKSQKL